MYYCWIVDIDIFDGVFQCIVFFSNCSCKWIQVNGDQVDWVDVVFGYNCFVGVVVCQNIIVDFWVKGFYVFVYDFWVIGVV